MGLLLPTLVFLLSALFHVAMSPFPDLTARTADSPGHPDSALILTSMALTGGVLLLGAFSSLAGWRWGTAVISLMTALVMAFLALSSTGLEHLIGRVASAAVASAALPILAIGAAVLLPPGLRGTGIALTFALTVALLPSLGPEVWHFLAWRLTRLELFGSMALLALLWTFTWLGLTARMAGTGAPDAEPEEPGISLRSPPAWAFIFGLLFTACLFGGLRTAVLGGESPGAGRLLGLIFLTGPVLGAAVAALATDWPFRSNAPRCISLRALALVSVGVLGLAGLLAFAGGKVGTPHLVLAGLALAVAGWTAWSVSLLALVIETESITSIGLVVGVGVFAGGVAGLIETAMVSALDLDSGTRLWRFLELTVGAGLAMLAVWRLSRQVESPSPPSLTPAGFWNRLGALSVDLMVFVVVMAAARYGLDSVAEPIPAIAKDFVALSGTILAFLAYLLLMEGSPLRATIGKLVFRIRVAAEDGSEPGFWRGFMRQVCKIFSIPFGLGFLMVAFHCRKQALHDVMSACTVLQKRSAPDLPVGTPPPRLKAARRSGSLLGLEISQVSHPESPREPKASPRQTGDTSFD